MNEAKEVFLIAVENVIAQCLIPVPSAPLRALGAAICPDKCDDVVADISGADELDAMFKLWDAAEEVEWSCWSYNEEGSQQALVGNGTVLRLADALRAYREAEAEPQADSPLSAPHWEAVTPALMAVDA